MGVFRLFSHGGVELAVGLEIDRATIGQTIVFEIIQPEEHLLTAGYGAVSAGVGRDANYDVGERGVYYSIAISGRRLGRVEEVDVAVGGELGIEGISKDTQGITVVDIVRRCPRR